MDLDALILPSTELTDASLLNQAADRTTHGHAAIPMLQQDTFNNDRKRRGTGRFETIEDFGGDFILLYHIVGNE